MYEQHQRVRSRLRNTTAVAAMLKQLFRDQSGSAVLMSLFALVIMLMFLGLGVDVLLAEKERIKLQSTLDRAVLAAADLDQEIDPQAVVEDYFDKAGLREFLTDVTVTETVNSRRVEASAVAASPKVLTKAIRFDRAEAQRYLTHLKEKYDAAEAAGVEITPELRRQFEEEARDQLGGSSPVLLARAGGGAEERVTDIEISLVVDISGSMGWNGNRRLDNLKTAADEFFDLVANDGSAGEGMTSVSVVPYNHSVNVGADLLDRFDVTEWHTQANCIRFRDSDFDTVGIPLDQELERMAHFSWGRNSYNAPKSDAYACVNNENHAILAYATDVDDMKAHVQGLNAGGATASDLGMKWGAALLDPEARPIVNQMVNENATSSLITDWPVDYGTEDSMKVIVLMTDGENTEQYDIADRFKSPDLEFDPYAANFTVPGYTHSFTDNIDGMRPALSPVYYSASWGSEDSDDGWIVYLNDEASSENLYRPMSPKKTDDDEWYGQGDLPADAVQMTWQDLWNVYSTEDAAYAFFQYSDPNGDWYRWRGRQYWNGEVPSYYHNVLDPVTIHDRYSDVDSRLKDICDAVRAKDILVFSIAFEAPEAGQGVMQYCASTPGNFYDVEGADLAYAFTAIANQINHLRLVQ